MHTYTPYQCPYKCQPSTPYGIKEITQTYHFKAHGYYDKVKGQINIHHDVAHLQPPTNVPTKYQLPTHYSFQDTASINLILPTPYSFGDIAQTRFYRSRSLWQGQIKVIP